MTQKNGQWILKRDHTYYYQIQTQLNVCNLSYCDFVVWTEGDSAVERITVDNTFYETVMEDIKHFLSMVYYQKFLASGIPGNI